MSDNASLARSIYEAWNERDFARGASLMAADGEIVVTGTGQRFQGSEGAIQFSRMWADAFPDGRAEITSVTDGGDTVVVEFTGTGTHTGPLATPMGEIPATGKSVEIHLCDVIEFSGGEVRQTRSYFDTAELMTQLGLMPEAQTASTG